MARSFRDDSPAMTQYASPSPQKAPAWLAQLSHNDLDGLLDGLSDSKQTPPRSGNGSLPRCLSSPAASGASTPCNNSASEPEDNTEVPEDSPRTPKPAPDEGEAPQRESPAAASAYSPAATPHSILLGHDGAAVSEASFPASVIHFPKAHERSYRMHTPTVSAVDLRLIAGVDSDADSPQNLDPADFVLRLRGDGARRSTAANGTTPRKESPGGTPTKDRGLLARNSASVIRMKVRAALLRVCLGSRDPFVR